LEKYCGIKYRGIPRDYHKSNNDLRCKARKMEIPPFDGATKSLAKAWVYKMDAYLQLNPMMEFDSIKFSTLYLEGKGHEWWYHGMTTLGHAHITSYAYFIKRLIYRFDQGDPELHLREFTQLGKTRSTEEYI
jgi:hypothetical protein